MCHHEVMSRLVDHMTHTIGSDIINITVNTDLPSTHADTYNQHGVFITVQTFMYMYMLYDNKPYNNCIHVHVLVCAHWCMYMYIHVHVHVVYTKE